MNKGLVVAFMLTRERARIARSEPKATLIRKLLFTHKKAGHTETTTSKLFPIRILLILALYISLFEKLVIQVKESVIRFELGSPNYGN